jgi:excisionase family DNA binding protein
MDDLDELLDIEQAAKFLNVSETSIRRWTNAGRLACYRVGPKRERRFRHADLIAFMERQGVAAVGTPIDAAEEHVDIDGVKLRFGSHLAGLYSSDLGRIRLAISFLADGFRPGSVNFLVALPATRDDILGHLEREGRSIAAEVDAGRLVLLAYHRTGREQIDRFAREFTHARHRGARSFRLVGDMTGFAEHVSREGLHEYESAYDQLIASRFPVVTLCQYDVRLFSNDDVLQALRAHPDTFSYPADRVLG